jgi:UDP-glucose 4-epimerase
MYTTKYSISTGKGKVRDEWKTSKSILVTGGCGFIGSHTIVCLLTAGHRVTVVDNLVNSAEESLARVRDIMVTDVGIKDFYLTFHKVDLCDRASLQAVFAFQSTPFDCCIHFAGLKAVGESMSVPLRYYENNLIGTMVLLSLMDEYGCRSMVFSSSATVYGAATTMPFTEDTPTGAGITNAYGRTKHMIEGILHDFGKSKELQPDESQRWSITVLRYFNPVGAHPSGKIGEDPNGPPNNLMPFVSQVAVGRREFLTVFGTDYDTPDGTGVRDYIHVMDLAQGHLSALDYMGRVGPGNYVFNLGTGNGYSVLQMVAAMEKASGRQIAYKVGARRPGDIATCYADAQLAKREMGWEATRGLDEMCKDLWCWQQNNPNGFAK